MTERRREDRLGLIAVPLPIELLLGLEAPAFLATAGLSAPLPRVNIS